MKVAFFSVILNNHQANLADEMYKHLGDDFVFVELENLLGENRKGATEDYSVRPYLLQSWKDVTSFNKAMDIALAYDVCLFDGGFNYLKARMRTGKLTFDFSERWLKGLKNFLSPRLWNTLLMYHLCSWRKQPLYKLCASAFAKHDQNILGTFIGKCYKFGYFTEVPEYLEKSNTEINSIKSIRTGQGRSRSVRLMWCANFIKLKHPELAIECAKRLKDDGYKFLLDMYGDGPLRESSENRVGRLGLSDVVKFNGNVPNKEVLRAMRGSDIFLFTSDKREGWGAVVNEAMANGCCLVGGSEIGSVPYLIKEGINGMTFKSKSIDDLYLKVRTLMDNPERRLNMSKQAHEDMVNLWSPRHAAVSLLQLIDDLQNGRNTSIMEGPCSRA